MTSWVHLFSKFTSEALLFEAAFICFLIGSYIAYSVVRKRREGSVTEAVPSSVVKVYLNELITDAEQMRAQLFGLLQSSGISTGHIGNTEAGKAALLASLQAQHGHESTAAAGQDSELLHKISALEARMKDQARAMELLVQEKTRIEGELTIARSKADKPQASGAVSAGPDTSELQKKIAQLEGKLAEYSVIEDDLANLKRLQQENAELKSRFSSAGAEPPAAASISAAASAVVVSAQQPEAAPVTEAIAAPAAEAAMAETAHSVETPVEAQAAEAAVEVAPAPSVELASETVVAEAPAETPAPTAAEAPAEQPDSQAAFAALATQVDASLTEVPPASASTSPAETAEKPKDEEPKPSEADLLAEFEKMLNG